LEKAPQSFSQNKEQKLYSERGVRSGSTQWFKRSRPPAARPSDLPSFDISEPEAHRRDVPNADVRVLDAGHFALDTNADEIVALRSVHEEAEMSTTIREALAGSRWSRGQDFMGKRLALLATRLLVSVNLLYAAIFLKFAGVPDSVTLFTQMSQAVHGLVSQPVFRLGSGVFETVVAVLLLIPKTARLGAGLTVVWMTAVILSHIFVLGYGWFFVDALTVMALAVIYLLLTRR
jgi:hypothetical protein